MSNCTFKVLAIFTSPNQGEQMVEHDNIEVTLDGLKGDRYSTAQGFYSGKRIPDIDRSITIISASAIEEANLELIAKGIKPFTFVETRRNILVDIDKEDLNNLLHKKFKIGEVELEGTDACTPCKRPPELLNLPIEQSLEFIRAFLNRGGLRVRVIKTGYISKGLKLEF